MAKNNKQLITQPARMETISHHETRGFAPSDRKQTRYVVRSNVILARAVATPLPANLALFFSYRQFFRRATTSPLHVTRVSRTRGAFACSPYVNLNNGHIISSRHISVSRRGANH